jgi:DNA replication protein DnaD
MAIERRTTSKAELDEVIEYWLNCPRCSSHLNEDTLIRFLQVFTPHQIKGAMYLATSTRRQAYFRYLCGILHNWRKELEQGEQPRYFDIGQES